MLAAAGSRGMHCACSASMFTMPLIAPPSPPPPPTNPPPHTLSHMHSFVALWLDTPDLIITRASKGGLMRTFSYDKLEQAVISLVVSKHCAIRKLPCQPAVSQHGQHPFPHSFCQLVLECRSGLLSTTSGLLHRHFTVNIDSSRA